MVAQACHPSAGEQASGWSLVLTGLLGEFQASGDSVSKKVDGP